MQKGIGTERNIKSVCSIMKTHLGGGPGMSREMTQRQIDEEKLKVLSEHVRLLEEKIQIHETKESCQNDTFKKLLELTSGENPNQSHFDEHQGYLDILVKNMNDTENKLTELNNQLAELKGPHPVFEVTLKLRPWTIFRFSLEYNIFLKSNFKSILIYKKNSETIILGFGNLKIEEKRPKNLISEYAP